MMSKLNKAVGAAVSAAAILAGAGVAQATTFYLTQDGCTGGCLVAPSTYVGTVDVTGLGTNVLNFSVNLINGATFNDAGINPSHIEFGFNLVGDPSVTITNIVTSLPNGLTPVFGPPDFTASPFGSFDDALARMTAGTQNDGGSSLSFTVTGASGSMLNFDPNEAIGGVILEADVFSNGNTGSVGALGADGAVPEPASWALMLVGFGGMGAAMRLRRRALAPAA